MKKILSMAAIALIMAGCSNDEEKIVIDNGEASDAVPVLVSQKVAGVETKGAVTLGSTMQAVILMVDESSSTPNFNSFKAKTDNTLEDNGAGGKKLSSDANRADVATTEFTASTTAGDIKLNPTLYYPISSTSTNTYLLGVSPQGVVDKTNVTFNVVDGSQDVMYAEPTTAANSSSPQTPELEFKHQTTQLLFVAKLSSADLTSTEWAGKTVSVQNIIIQKADVPSAIKISDGSLTCKEMDITVKGCAGALSTTPCAKSTPVMIKASTKIIVNVVLSVGDETIAYNNLVVKADNGTDNLATQAGKSHLITFTITPPVSASDGIKVDAKAKIVDWEEGDPGKVEIK